MRTDLPSSSPPNRDRWVVHVVVHAGNRYRLRLVPVRAREVQHQRTHGSGAGVLGLREHGHGSRGHGVQPYRVGRPATILVVHLQWFVVVAGRARVNVNPTKSSVGGGRRYGKSSPPSLSNTVTSMLLCGSI